jgi:hypothetical protein
MHSAGRTVFDQSGYADGAIGLIRKRETKNIEQILFYYFLSYFVLETLRPGAVKLTANIVFHQSQGMSGSIFWYRYSRQNECGQNVSIATHLWVLPAAIHLGLLARIRRQGFARNQNASHLAGRT